MEVRLYIIQKYYHAYLLCGLPSPSPSTQHVRSLLDLLSCLVEPHGTQEKGFQDVWDPHLRTPKLLNPSYPETITAFRLVIQYDPHILNPSYYHRHWAEGARPTTQTSKQFCRTTRPRSQRPPSGRILGDPGTSGGCFEPYNLCVCIRMYMYRGYT